MVQYRKYTETELNLVARLRSEGVLWKVIAHRLNVPERTLQEAYRRLRKELPPSPKATARPVQCLINLETEVHANLMRASMAAGKTFTQFVNDVLKLHLSQPQTESRPNGPHPDR
jgi:hypothetical protein